MKNRITESLRAVCLLGCLAVPVFACPACADDEIERPAVTEPLMPDLGPEGAEGTIALSEIARAVAFTAGEESHSYRIPALVTAVDGSLLLFAEARRETWKDKSWTDVVVKRSADGGATWSQAVNLTAAVNDGAYAFMDPAPVVDAGTGNVYLFCCRWNKGNAEAKNNRAFLIVSSDNGATWGEPKDVTERVVMPGWYCSGFGPGSGIRIAEGRYAGRLILASRQFDGSSSTGVALYSDDGGATWRIGSKVLGGESQIADCGHDRLTINIRKGADRYSAFSKDGGVTWTTAMKDAGLPSLASGCHAGVCGVGGTTVFYCGPAGGVATSSNDNRSGLTILRSMTGGDLWTRSRMLYELASGYADMTLLPDGRLAVAFEAGPEKGFIRRSDRPAGWMRIDVLVLPAEVTDRGYWFE